MTWRRLLFILVILAMFSTAAAPADSTKLAVNIATGLLMVAAPFLGLAQLHLKDEYIVLASLALAFVIAVIAQFATGDLKVADLQAGIWPLLGTFGKLWAIQQAVFQLFKDNSILGPRLTTKPLLVAAPPAPAPPSV